MNAIELFAIVTIINVIFSTCRSLLTIKGNWWVAALTNAITYGFYTYVVVLTASGEVDLMVKIGITALANFFGVAIVKIIEKKMTPDKLWKIEFTAYSKDNENIRAELDTIEAQYCYNEFGKHTKFEVFTATQEKSREIAKIVKAYNGKYFITENRSTLY